MADIWTMGELLVEVMRPEPGMGLSETGPFVGPFPSGAPGIFIDTAARLGHSAAIVSGVGDDDFGRCILERLRRDGVDTGFVEVFAGRSTGVAFVTYFGDGSRRFLFHWNGTPAVMARVPEPDAVRNPRIFHVMGCSLMANTAFRERIYEAVELFAAKGASITFDPNIRTELLQEGGVEPIVAPILRRSTVLFPGESELRLLAGVEDIEEAAQRLLCRNPALVIVVKRGRRGCTVFTDERSFSVPAFSIREADPTGAGDCFDAAFLCGWLEGLDLRDCARMGAAAGALNAQAFGPMEGSISRENLERLLRGA